MIVCGDSVAAPSSELLGGKKFRPPSTYQRKKEKKRNESRRLGLLFLWVLRGRRGGLRGGGGVLCTFCISLFFRPIGSRFNPACGPLERIDRTPPIFLRFTPTLFCFVFLLLYEKCTFSRSISVTYGRKSLLVRKGGNRYSYERKETITYGKNP